MTIAQRFKAFQRWDHVMTSISREATAEMVRVSRSASDGSKGSAKTEAFRWPLGVTQGESPQRALTEEQQRGQAKARPLLLHLKFTMRSGSVPTQTPLRQFMRWFLGLTAAVYSGSPIQTPVQP